MKRVGIVLCMLFLLGFTSCKKYKQNQPAYLAFSWGFSQNSFSESTVVLTGGSFYSGKVNVDGSRTDAPEVAIEQSFPAQKVSYQSEGLIGLKLDVPVGDYNQFNVKFTMDHTTTPCLVLNGKYMKGTEEIPVRMEWSSVDLLNFVTQNGFTLKKKKEYTVKLNVSTTSLFSSVSSLQWDQASISMENDIPTMIVRDNINVGVFNDINEKLQSALTVVVQ